MDLQTAELAHDIRMPLQLISSCAQLMEMETLPERAREYLELLLRSAQDLQNMLHSTLDNAGKGASTLQREVRDVVRDARMLCAQCRPMAQERNVDLTFSANVAAFRMSMDAEKQRRILLNLIANALKYTPAGGSVQVSVRVRGDSVELAVRDSGCGMDRCQQRRIFASGETTGGYGYGLSIVRDFAEQLGGDVRVQSAPGKGSLFIVRLPVGIPKAQTPARTNELRAV